MSQNTDPFPTPRGALSPEGVSARALREDAEFQQEMAREGMASSPPISETPEPQGPTTEAGRRFLEWAATSAHMHRNSSSYDAIEARILAIEAEARAAAPPDIDVLRQALADAVQMLDWTGDMAMHLPYGYDEVRLRSLALIDPESAERAKALQERLAATRREPE